MGLLDHIVVLECSSSFTASNIGLRLTQLGANVMRVVNSERGESLCHESFYGQYVDNKSLLYYSKCRGKEELLIDPNSEASISIFHEYLSKADVIIYDYNRNVFAEFGIDVTQLRTLYPQLIVAEFSDYGSHTLYAERLGDDLLIQAFSGITWLTANRDDAPTPMGFKVASQFCSTYLTQGIMAALYRREVDGGVGSRVSSSLLEAIVLVQLEVITTAANSGMNMPKRTKRGNAHAGLPAPYGVYRSKDGFFAMSFVAIPILTDIMGVEIPEHWQERESWLWYRDEIMEFLEPHFLTKTNQEWLDIFTPRDVWCSDINDLHATLNLEAYKTLDLEEEYDLPIGGKFSALKLPYEISTIESTYKKTTSQSSNTESRKHPYDGLLVIDISQYLSGPTSTLQLADFGATVVKIERPKGGDMGRNVIINNLLLDDTSSSFLAVGRNKRSAALDLKDDSDREKVKELMRQADVVIQNFRPSVMARLGLDYEAIRQINPSVIYAEISGYGDKGCWVRKPGQDYIVQALSGLCMLSGQHSQEPIPIGLSVVDLIAGCHVDEAVTAALYNREVRGEGAHIKVTMFGSAMDLQSDFITAHRWNNNDGILRQDVSNVHPGEDAPSGIYKTTDGYIAISSMPTDKIIDISTIDTNIPWRERQRIIKEAIAQTISTETSQSWTEKLSAIPGALCGEIQQWQDLFNSHQGASLKMLQQVKRCNGFTYTTTRCPVRFNDQIMTSELGAPQVGEYTNYIIDKYNL